VNNTTGELIILKEKQCLDGEPDFEEKKKIPKHMRHY
jgi:hypothetical protein